MKIDGGIALRLNIPKIMYWASGGRRREGDCLVRMPERVLTSANPSSREILFSNLASQKLSAFC